MTPVTVDATDLAELMYSATALLDADDLPAELRRCWHHLATQAPDDALALLQLLEDDIADALTDHVLAQPEAHDTDVFPDDCSCQTLHDHDCPDARPGLRLIGGGAA